MNFAGGQNTRQTRLQDGRQTTCQEAAQARRSSAVRTRTSTKAGSSWLRQPAELLCPRIIFALAVFALLAFGTLMIYSASSITSLISKSYGYDASYFVERQLIFAAVGLVLASALVFFDYHLWSGTVLKIILAVTYLMLLAIHFTSAGSDAYGATRWIAMGPFHLQPSEFAKVTIILSAASLMVSYQQRKDFRELLGMFAIAIVIPLFLIISQPDKGTVLVLGTTLLVMAYGAGVPGKWVFLVLVLALLAMITLSLKQGYSRARIQTLADPWADPFGSGYQLTQGFMAFGSGGLFGVGIGMGRQKYSYLPMAYNDFIFAVIGEECGLVGTLAVLVAFAALLWAGFRIAKYAPDLCGRLIAMGCTSLLVIQMLLNVSGVVGAFPLSGKPIPFLSYGGSSIMSSLMLVGLVLSVSFHSELPQSEHEQRRNELFITRSPRTAAPRVNEGAQAFASDGTVGEVTLRSERSRSPYGANSQSSYRGSLQSPYNGSSSNGVRNKGSRNLALVGRSDYRVTTDASGRTRIDLGPSPSERLRSGKEGPRVRDGRDRSLYTDSGTRLRTRKGDRRGRS